MVKLNRNHYHAQKNGIARLGVTMISSWYAVVVISWN